MRILHQTGHNWIWNIQSLQEDNSGDGLILSPVNNMGPEKLARLPLELRQASFFDPQVYLPKESKKHLRAYGYFPSSLKDGFETDDFSEVAENSAHQCLDLQVKNGLSAVVIPTRYFEALPSDFLSQLSECFVEPYVAYYLSKNLTVPLLLTVIVKPIQLADEEQNADLLNWATSFPAVSGVYLIFENTFSSKRIKDAAYLANALAFIRNLKQTGLTVHLGYTDVEAFLYSIADPDSISVGAYENLRNFGVKRFRDSEGNKMRSPNPRMYSGALLQWIEYGYLDAIRQLYGDWSLLFEDSKYKPLMFTPTFEWHFQKPELYKHYFTVFSKQISSLPADMTGRLNHVANSAQIATSRFEKLKECGVFLNPDSDGSHLSFWLTAISVYKKKCQL